MGREIDEAELARLLASDAGILLVDVRSEEEFAASPRTNAVNWPLDCLSDRLGEIGSGQRLVFACTSGKRARQARSFATMGGHADALCVVPAAA